MNIYRNLFQSIAVALLFASATLPAHTLDPFDDGRVSHLVGSSFEVCFPSAAAPAPGRTIQIFRADYIFPNKGPVREQYRPIGRGRITAAIQGGCAQAELTQGSADRLSHVRPTASGGD